MLMTTMSTALMKIVLNVGGLLMMMMMMMLQTMTTTTIRWLMLMVIDDLLATGTYHQFPVPFLAISATQDLAPFLL